MEAAVLPYMLIMCFLIVVIAIFACAIIILINKLNTLKAEYLHTKQKEKLYEKSISLTNEQIEKISGIKHDMNNRLMSLKALIKHGDIEQAINLCDSSYDKLEATYTTINSSNPILNAIINIELEKAASSEIKFSVDISENLAQVSSADTVSLIGNLCDNAIEYLSTQPKENRKMTLQIYSQLNFNVITCKNKISDSVLSDNPDLTTNKSDKSNHGKGTAIIKRIAKEHDGDIMYGEENGYFTVSVLLCKK